MKRSRVSICLCSVFFRIGNLGSRVDEGLSGDLVPRSGLLRQISLPCVSLNSGL